MSNQKQNTTNTVENSNMKHTNIKDSNVEHSHTEHSNVSHSRSKHTITDYHIIEALRDMAKQTDNFHNRNKRFLQTLVDNIRYILQDEEDIVRCQYVLKQDNPENFDQFKFEQLLDIQTKLTEEQHQILSSIPRPIKKTFSIDLNLIQKILSIYQESIKNHFRFMEYFEQKIAH